MERRSRRPEPRASPCDGRRVDGRWRRFEGDIVSGRRVLFGLQVASVAGEHGGLTWCLYVEGSQGAGEKDGRNRRTQREFDREWRTI
jgi:hypothetical protein